MSEPVLGDVLPPVYPTSEDGQIMGVVTASKVGQIECAPEPDGKRGLMPAVAGSVVAGELKAAFTLSEAEQETRWNRLRLDSPWEIVGWSLSAHDVVEPLKAILGPEELRRTGFEVYLYPPDSAAEAALKAGALLELEQGMPEESDKPVADTLRRSLLIGNPGELTGVPADYMKRLLTRAHPEDGLEDLIYTMRTHHFAGDLVMAQKARADFMNVKFENGNIPEHRHAEQIADMFHTVLDSRNACNPDILNAITLLYVDSNGEQRHMRGPEIVHKAAELILSGKIKLQIGEIKALTLIGDQYDGFDRLYRQSGYNLQDALSDWKLANPANRELRRNLLYKFEYDIAKTSLAVWNMFRIAENEYHTQPQTIRGQGNLFIDDDTRRPDGLPESFIDPTLVMREVDKLIVPIKFDIRANGHAVPTDENDPQPEYVPVPSLRKLGVPEEIDVAHRFVESSRIEQFWRLWAWELAEPEAVKDRQEFTSKVIAAVQRSKGLATVG